MSTSPTSKPLSVQPSVTNEELDLLMELDTIKAVIKMGFSEEKVRATVKHGMEQRHLPFFNLKECIEAIIVFMEKESCQTLNERCNQETIRENILKFSD